MNVLLVQCRSVEDPETNLKFIRNEIESAQGHHAIDAVFLPELFYSLTNGQQKTRFLVEPGNQHYRNIQGLAKDYQVALIGGSAATLVGGKVFNRAYNFDSLGNELGYYDKINLFAINVDANDTKHEIIDETSIFVAGSSPALIDVLGWRVGLGICFDVRFPELFRNYAAQGAEILTVASAFTRTTGPAHWEVLMRARAIENQAYVVASAQVGVHNERISTHGHSMIVDPWGKVLLNLGDSEGAGVFELNRTYMTDVRARLDVLPR